MTRRPDYMTRPGTAPNGGPHNWGTCRCGQPATHPYQPPTATHPDHRCTNCHPKKDQT